MNSKSIRNENQLLIQQFLIDFPLITKVLPQK